MTADNLQKPNRRTKKKYSSEDKRAYCDLWRKSSLTKVEFCKLNGISKSALYRWMQESEGLPSSTFSPVVINENNNLQDFGATTIEINLPNNVQLKMKVGFQHIGTLIQEIGHAAAIIR